MFWEIVAALVVLFLVFLYANRAKTIPGVPHVPQSFFFGGLPTFRQNFHRIHDWNLELARKFKRSFTMGLPFKPINMRIVSPECAEHILKTNFANYVKVDSPYVKLQMQELFGDGIFAVDGKGWTHQRKIASSLFKMSTLRDYMATVFEQHGNDFCRLIDQFEQSQKTFDLQELFFRYTMDCISEIAFGYNLDTLGLPLDRKPEFSAAFDDMQELIVRRGMLPPWLLQLRKTLQIGSEKDVVRCQRILDETVYNIIAERRARKARGERVTKPDLIEMFFNEAEEKQLELHDHQLRDLVMNFMIAGRDTTACLLTWSFYKLATEPQMAQRVREEVAAVCNGRAPTQAEAAQLKYTHAFLSEVLRMFPPVPWDFKRALNEDVLPDGTPVPKGTIMLYSPYVFGRLEENWERAETFDPTRWLDQPEPSQYKFITFNAGPRLCLGKAMAYQEAKTLLAMLVQRFEFSLVEERYLTQQPEYRPSIILQMKNGLQMRVKRL